MESRYFKESSEILVDGAETTFLLLDPAVVVVAVLLAAVFPAVPPPIEERLVEPPGCSFARLVGGDSEDMRGLGNATTTKALAGVAD